MRETHAVWPGRIVLAGVLLILYAPVLMIGVYSFNDSRLGMVWQGFTTRWYGELFRDAELAESLKRSVLIGVAASTASVALGTLAALGLSCWQPRPRRLMQGLLALPLVVPDMVLAVALAVYFHALGAEKGWLTVVLAHTAFGVAYAFVVVSAAVSDLDPNLYAAALDCGATPWQAVWRVLAPILAPSLVVAWLFVFVLSFDDFLITFFTTGPGNDTLPIKIYTRMNRGVPPHMNALFVLLFLVTLAGALLVLRVSRKRKLEQ
jgi:spermidine/putrescine transport system permease protein